MDIKTKIIIGMAIIILLGGGVYAYNYISYRAYELGFQDATTLINKQVYDNLAQNGYIVYSFQDENNKVQSIKLIPEQKKK